jgi:SsrA-binding protein
LFNERILNNFAVLKTEATNKQQLKEKIISLNKRAYHEFEILNKYEAGMVLKGTEVKSLREQKVSLQEAFGKVKNNEVWLINSTIPIYKHGNIQNHEPTQDRKLLLNKKEIRKIIQKLKDQGMTLIPLKIYFKGSKVKLELGLGKGKKLYDKRESIKKSETERRLKKIKGSF